MADGVKRDVIERLGQRPLDSPHLGRKKLDALLSRGGELMAGGPRHRRQGGEEISEWPVGAAASLAVQELAVE